MTDVEKAFQEGKELATEHSVLVEGNAMGWSGVCACGHKFIRPDIPAMRVAWKQHVIAQPRKPKPRYTVAATSQYGHLPFRVFDSTSEKNDQRIHGIAGFTCQSDGQSFADLMNSQDAAQSEVR